MKKRKLDKWIKALEDLQLIAQKLNIEVVYDRIEGEGGFCIVHNRPMMIMNRIYSPQAQVSIFLRNLNKRYSLDDFYLSPFIRDLLDKSYLSNAS